MHFSCTDLYEGYAKFWSYSFLYLLTEQILILMLDVFIQQQYRSVN